MIRVLVVNISGMGDGEYRRLYDLASAQRRERADRYLRREDAVRCVTAEALLRYVTGGNVSVLQTTEGKPYLPDAPNFHFNLTHSGDFVAIAYGSSPVGIDIEQIRPDGFRPEIARRFFTPAEQEFSATPEKFFQIWSMKESYLKCLGTGLAYPMQSVDVLAKSLAPQFYIGGLPGHTLAVFSVDADKKVEEITVSQLISSFGIT